MKKLFILAACFAVGVSCTDVNPVNGPEFGDATRADIVFKFDKSTRATETGTGDENTVNFLEVYVFDAEGTTLDLKVNGAAATAGEKGYARFNEPTFTETAGNDGTFKTQIEMSAGDSKQVLVVANAWLGTPAEIVTKLKAQDTANGTTLWNSLAADASNLSLRAIMSLVRGAEMSNAAAADGNPTAVTTFNSKKGFVMTGLNLDADVVANKSDNKIRVQLDRNVSKIKMPVKDATVNTGGLDQEELNTLFGFQADGTTPNVIFGENTTNALPFNITGFAVINGLKKSTVGFVGKTATTPTADPGYGDDDYTYNPVLNGDVYAPSYTLGWANEWTAWQAGKIIGTDWGTVIGGVYNKVTETAANSDELARGGRIASNSEAMKAADKGIAALGEWYAYSGTAGNAIITDATKSVYVYESKPGLKQAFNDSYEGFDADDAIAIILQGTLSASWGSPVPTAHVVTRYWRIDIRLQDAFHITRNAAYNTLVNTVSTPGYATPWEAEESEDIIGKPGDTISEFIISINEWITTPVGNGQI